MEQKSAKDLLDASVRKQSQAQKQLGGDGGKEEMGWGWAMQKKRGTTRLETSEGYRGLWTAIRGKGIIEKGCTISHQAGRE